MNVNINETVTLSLENYEEMKAEIKSLRQQVQEKTIIKEVKVVPPIYGYLGMIIVVFLFLLFDSYKRI